MGRLATDFYKACKGLGLLNAFRIVLRPRVLGRLGIKNKDNEAIDKFIARNFSDIIKKYEHAVLPESCVIPKIIWVFWWQGEKSMPSVIKVCYNSLQRNANGRKVILLDQSNYTQYAHLPEYIIDKLVQGKISFTHFSDVLRVALLKDYGGLWMDAAIFVTKPIPLHDGNFYSPRLNEELQNTAHMSQWVIGVMEAPKQMPLFLYMYDLLIAYWKKYDGVFSYLMFDCFIKYGYEHIDWIKNLLSQRPIESPDLHSSRYTFSNEVDDDVLNNLISNNNFLSLTWRIEYPKYAENGKETFYYALLKKYNIKYQDGPNSKDFRGGQASNL